MDDMPKNEKQTHFISIGSRNKTSGKRRKYENEWTPKG